MPEPTWVDLELDGRGNCPATAGRYRCVPAWDITAVYDQPDQWLAHPDPACSDRRGLFWNRHVDRRFSLSYPHSTAATPRVLGGSVNEQQEAWDRAEVERRRILREMHVAPDAAPAAVARALAEWFLYEHFQHREPCPAFPENPRNLDNGFDAIFYQSWCNGCAKAFNILGDLSGLTTRAIGCTGHIVAEVLLDGQWHHIENSGRHGPGLGAFFNTSYLRSYINPTGDFGVEMNDKYRAGLFKRPNPQFHFHNGRWESPLTLRWSMQCAAALYPEEDRLPCKADEGCRLPLVRYAYGFYWPMAHTSLQPQAQERRLHAAPGLPEQHPARRDYLFHPFQPGQAVRHSFQLDDLTGINAVELTLTLANSNVSNFSAAAGRDLKLVVNGHAHALAELTAWPPVDQQVQPLSLTVVLPRAELQPGGLNWIELHHCADSLYYLPCAPAVLEGMPPALGLG